MLMYYFFTNPTQIHSGRLVLILSYMLYLFRLSYSIIRVCFMADYYIFTMITCCSWSLLACGDKKFKINDYLLFIFIICQHLTLPAGPALLHRRTQSISLYVHAACTVGESWFHSHRRRIAPLPFSYLGCYLSFFNKYIHYTVYIYCFTHL